MRGGGDAGKGDIEKLRGEKVGSQGEMWREREGKREMERTMNGGMQRIFFSPPAKAAFRGTASTENH